MTARLFVEGARAHAPAWLMQLLPDATPWTGLSDHHLSAEDAGSLLDLISMRPALVLQQIAVRSLIPAVVGDLAVWHPQLLPIGWQCLRDLADYCELPSASTRATLIQSNDDLFDLESHRLRDARMEPSRVFIMALADDALFYAEHLPIERDTHAELAEYLNTCRYDWPQFRVGQYTIRNGVPQAQRDEDAAGRPQHVIAPPRYPEWLTRSGARPPEEENEQCTLFP